MIGRDMGKPPLGYSFKLLETKNVRLVCNDRIQLGTPSPQTLPIAFNTCLSHSSFVWSTGRPLPTKRAWTSLSFVGSQSGWGWKRRKKWWKMRGSYCHKAGPLCGFEPPRPAIESSDYLLHSSSLSPLPPSEGITLDSKSPTMRNVFWRRYPVYSPYRSFGGESDAGTPR